MSANLSIALVKNNYQKSHFPFADVQDIYSFNKDQTNEK